MVARLLLGRRSDGSYGLDITRPGFSVTASNPDTQPERFAFSSNWTRIDELLQIGTAVAQTSGQESWVDIDVTSYGYFPFITYRLGGIFTDTQYHDEAWHKYPNSTYSSLLSVNGYTATGSSFVRFARQNNGVNWTPAINFTLYYMIWGIKARDF